MPPSPEQREQDVAWRERNREEDGAFREKTREMDHHRRREESGLASRRAAANAAAELCEKGTPVARMLEMAAEIEAWIKAVG